MKKVRFHLSSELKLADASAEYGRRDVDEAVESERKIVSRISLMAWSSFVYAYHRSRTPCRPPISEPSVFSPDTITSPSAVAHASWNSSST